jgi:hypothetical protein
MDQLSGFPGLGKGDGPEAGLDAMCEEPCCGKVGAFLRIKE